MTPCRDAAEILTNLPSLLQSLDRRTCRSSPYRSVNTAYHLEHRILHASLVCHTALYTFGNQLLRILPGSSDPCCRFPWRRWSPCHGIPCTFFPGTARMLPGALIASCEHAAHHADICRRLPDRLGHISGILDTAVGDYRNAILLRLPRSSP